ncbi:hypothetical protein PuT2_15520, partial [Pusillimonas sp. T2]|uniref:hypothetical protein n=1 Tax=Pusillimonas sp. T2 TaxID=1548123 RepID=UPI000B9CB771
MTTLERDTQIDSWQRFVLENGWRASGYDLAHVLGRSVRQIDQVRKTAAMRKLTKSKTFNELFTLWHGRSPADADWPVPRKLGNRTAYEWQAPELALLASLVGQLGVKEIALTLTERLRQITNDRLANRTAVAVQNQITRLGLQTSDVMGGITIPSAGKEVGSIAIVQHAIRTGHLRANRVGRLWVIPYDAWGRWKSTRVFAPEGYVQLSTLKQALAIRSDKLSEFARMGYIPGTIRTTPFGASVATTQHGTWYIDANVAKKLLADRKAGRPMPWHGKPLLDNLRVTYKLWCERKHPTNCSTCQEIWGNKGAPATFDEYVERYPPLAHGAKRHLTRIWTPGLTPEEVAKQFKVDIAGVQLAMANGMLVSQVIGGTRYVTQSEATRWRARRYPTGENAKSWISLPTAACQYLFTISELRSFVAKKTLLSRTGTHGAARGTLYVSKHQCAQLRANLGFSLEEAARRAGISVERFSRLLDGVNWRASDHTSSTVKS